MTASIGMSEAAVVIGLIAGLAAIVPIGPATAAAEPRSNSQVVAPSAR